MNENSEYLEHEINLYKNTRHMDNINNKELRINYQISWNDLNHQTLIEIAKLHGISLTELIRIILINFLKCRKNYKKIRDKLL